MRPDRKREPRIKSFVYKGASWLGGRVASGLGVAISSGVTFVASTYFTRWIKHWLGE